MKELNKNKRNFWTGNVKKQTNKSWIILETIKVIIYHKKVTMLKRGPPTVYKIENISDKSMELLSFPFKR